MTADEFRTAAAESAGVPPAGLGGALLALWWEARGDWDRAHEAAQADRTRESSWVHAYLHRKDGDHDNAAYWYARAGQPVATGTAAAEWSAIATRLLTARG